MTRTAWLALVALLAALGLGILVSGCGGAAATKPPVDVPADAVAVVAGTPVTRAEFEKLMDRAKAAYEAQSKEFPTTGTPEYEMLKNDAVALLIRRIEFAREAETLGIAVTDAEVTARIDELKQQYYATPDGAVDEAKFKEELEAAHLTEEDLRAQVKADLVNQKLSESITKDLNVTDAEIQAYYDENPDRYAVPESREVAHILVESKAKADELYRELQGGANFAKLAKENSTDPGSAENGGKLEDTKGSFVPEFEEVAFALETGEIGEPVESEFGWHIIKALADTKPASVTPFADVQDAIREQLLQEKKDAATADWVGEIEAKYALQIAYAVGFEPPAQTSTTDTDSSSTTSTEP